eukprot:gb/GECG01013381.1/.p1 GENE.gb/GECG01013381.1/~~gb/GECG01013381.1/.p1  ORF type:complete len:1369 (+),score=187.51 gb/GECG01013381.1/:1-4107(+)
MESTQEPRQPPPPPPSSQRDHTAGTSAASTTSITAIQGAEQTSSAPPKHSPPPKTNRKEGGRSTPGTPASSISAESTDQRDNPPEALPNDDLENLTEVVAVHFQKSRGLKPSESREEAQRVLCQGAEGTPTTNDYLLFRYLIENNSLHQPLPKQSVFSGYLLRREENLQSPLKWDWTRRWIVISGGILLVFSKPTGEPSDCLGVYQLFGPGWRAALKCETILPESCNASYTFMLTMGKDALPEESAILYSYQDSHGEGKFRKDSSASADSPGSGSSKSVSSCHSAEAGAELAKAAARHRQQDQESSISRSANTSVDEAFDQEEYDGPIVGTEAIRLSEPKFEMFRAANTQSLDEWVNVINSQIYYSRVMPSSAFQSTHKDVWRDMNGAEVPVSNIYRPCRPPGRNAVRLYCNVDIMRKRVSFPLLLTRPLMGYSLHDNIGSGNYGSVTRASTTDGKYVAIKVMPKMVAKPKGKQGSETKEQKRQNDLIRSEIECLEILSTSVSNPHEVGLVALHAEDTYQIAATCSNPRPSDFSLILDGKKELFPELNCGIREDNENVYIIMKDIEGNSLLNLVEQPCPIRIFNAPRRNGEHNTPSQVFLKMSSSLREDSSSSASPRNRSHRKLGELYSGDNSSGALTSQASTNSMGIPVSMADSFALRDKVPRRTDLNPPPMDTGLPEGWVRKIVRRLSQALLSMHHRGITHRDVKLENVQISTTGEVFLLDYGFAAITDRVVNCSTMLVKNSSVICSTECHGIFAEFGPYSLKRNPVIFCVVQGGVYETPSAPPRTFSWMNKTKKKLYKMLSRNSSSRFDLTVTGQRSNALSGSAMAHCLNRVPQGNSDSTSPAGSRKGVSCNDGETAGPERAKAHRDNVVRNPSTILTTRLGTKYAMAPEIWKQEDYNTAVDAWGLGVIAFYTLFGEAPFSEFGGRGEFKSNLVSGNLVQPPSWEAVSEEARSLIVRLLDPDPFKRATVHDILHDPWMGIDLTEPASGTKEPIPQVQHELRSSHAPDSTASIASTASKDEPFTMDEQASDTMYADKEMDASADGERGYSVVVEHTEYAKSVNDTEHIEPEDDNDIASKNDDCLYRENGHREDSSLSDGKDEGSSGSSLGTTAQNELRGRHSGIGRDEKRSTDGSCDINNGTDYGGDADDTQLAYDNKDHAPDAEVESSSSSNSAWTGSSENSPTGDISKDQQKGVRAGKTNENNTASNGRVIDSNYSPHPISSADEYPRAGAPSPSSYHGDEGSAAGTNGFYSDASPQKVHQDRSDGEDEKQGSEDQHQETEERGGRSVSSSVAKTLNSLEHSHINESATSLLSASNGAGNSTASSIHDEAGDVTYPLEDVKANNDYRDSRSRSSNTSTSSGDVW